MGSASTDVRGLVGRPLAAGDVLGTAREVDSATRMSARVDWPVDGATVRILPGPQATREALERLDGAELRAAAGDRTGVRFEGAEIPGGESVSEPPPLGAVQITPNGEPVRPARRPLPHRRLREAGGRAPRRSAHHRPAAARACTCASSSSSPGCAGISTSSGALSSAVRGAPAPYPFTWAGRLCVLLALAKLALLLPILARYGWDRDELYFLAAGRHLAFGYVDFPPLTAVAARLVDGTIGPSLISLRLLCSLLAVVAAVAAGAIAREFGAGQRLQVLATAAWIVTPYALGGAVLFHPTFLELAATAMAMLAAMRLVVRGEPRQWILLGLWAGIGLESKYTIVVPAGGLPGGLCALAPRPAAAPRGRYSAC